MEPLPACHYYSWIPWDAVSSWKTIFRLNEAYKWSLARAKDLSPGTVIIANDDDDNSIDITRLNTLEMDPTMCLEGESGVTSVSDRRETLRGFAEMAFLAEVPLICVYTRDLGVHAPCAPAKGDEPLTDAAMGILVESIMSDRSGTLIDPLALVSPLISLRETMS